MNKPRCVLIVDDDPHVRGMLSESLRAEGYTVTTAENGWVGLNVLDSGEVDVVILDLLMPKMTGWDFLERRYTHPFGSDVPVVVVSGSLADVVIPELERLGVYAYFAKPFDLPELLKCIGGIVRGT